MMDAAGINWFAVEVIGVIILGLAIAWATLRNSKSRSRAEIDHTEQATRDLYREEERRSRDGTDTRAD